MNRNSESGDEDEVIKKEKAPVHASAAEKEEAELAALGGKGIKKAHQKITVRKAWKTTTNILTCCLPNPVLAFFIKGSAVQQAFREKLALNFIFLLISGLFILLVLGVGLILCPQKNVLSSYEIDALSNIKRPYVSAYGYYYKIGDVMDNHVYQAAYLNLGAFNATVIGQDVGPMFVKTDSFSALCPGLEIPPAGKISPLLQGGTILSELYQRAL